MASNRAVGKETTNFLELFEKRKQFERFASLYVHDSETVRDIVMDSYHYVWERHEELDMGAGFEAYMYQTVKNRCLDQLRRQLVRRSAESQIQDDAEWQLQMDIATLQAFEPTWLFDNELAERIRTAIEGLPERSRHFFKMSRDNKMTYAEIARAQSVSVKTVEFHISKALRQLRTELGDLLGSASV